MTKSVFIKSLLTAGALLAAYAGISAAPQTAPASSLKEPIFSVGSFTKELTNVQNANLYQPGTLLGGNTGGWSTKRIVGEHSLNFVPNFKGVPNAARFEIRPSDPKIFEGFRAELRDPYVASPGEIVWYRFRTLIPTDFPLDQKHSMVLAQWHDRKTGGEVSKRPPLAVRLVNGELRLTLWNDELFERYKGEGPGKIIYKSTEIQTGAWLVFTFQVKWSADEDAGFVRAWRNGRLIADYEGPIGYKGDIYGPYFKLGAYTVHDFQSPMVIYHTDYRRAADFESLYSEIWVEALGAANRRRRQGSGGGRRSALHLPEVSARAIVTDDQRHRAPA